MCPIQRPCIWLKYFFYCPLWGNVNDFYQVLYLNNHDHLYSCMVYKFKDFKEIKWYLVTWSFKESSVCVCVCTHVCLHCVYAHVCVVCVDACVYFLTFDFTDHSYWEKLWYLVDIRKRLLIPKIFQKAKLIDFIYQCKHANSCFWL